MELQPPLLLRVEELEEEGRGTFDDVELGLGRDRPLLEDDEVERPGIGGRFEEGFPLDPLELLDDFPFEATVGAPAIFLSTRNLGSKRTSPSCAPFFRVTTAPSMKFRSCSIDLMAKPISVASGLGMVTRLRSFLFINRTFVPLAYSLRPTSTQSGRSGFSSTGSGGSGGSTKAELR